MFFKIAMTAVRYGCDSGIGNGGRMSRVPNWWVYKELAGFRVDKCQRRYGVWNQEVADDDGPKIPRGVGGS